MISQLEIARWVATKEKIAIEDAYSIIRATIETIAECLKSDDVQLVGLGTFRRVTRKARPGRNPRTGEAITIPERTVVKFRPGKALRKH